MRSSRLTALLLHLQAVRRATAPELAAALEVSVRTVRRDIAALQDAGVPLWSEPGRHGGVRLTDGWRTDLDGLTGDEAAALLLAGAGPQILAGLGLATAAVAARTKVLAALPPRPRVHAGQVHQRFLLDAPGWFAREEAVPQLSALAEAVWAARRLDLGYARRDGDSITRRVDPLGLVCKAGTWYLVARHRGRILSYRVARIVSVGPRAETFDRPDDFDLAGWWRAAGDDFARSLMRWTCRLRLSPEAFTTLHGAVGPVAARDARANASDPDADGWRVVTLCTEGPDVALGQLRALGDGVEVLDPADLRAALAASARRTAERNAAPLSDIKQCPARQRHAG
ncbi:putative transcriptional regulator [Frankia sp. AiPs1]|uniref:helix-turn-helix transcriptional regulator n=1 Tax=Frankia sp. AiPa1 TaxID=573492 RepID=UPI00202B56A9|nr:WYL domain-containing protein [Frankia sp. AiPa1]MCL9762837.1 WYL domain-containing protein [Frankia sp. AiPa1]